MLETGANTKALIALKDAAGKSLNIVEGDTATLSIVSQGITYSTTISIASATKLSDLLTLGITVNGKTMQATSSDCNVSQSIGTDTAGSKVFTPNGNAALVVSSSETGISNQISGFVVTISDKNGNAKKSANEHLEFTTVQFASDKQTTDNSIKIHVGAAAGQTISIGLEDMRAEALGLQASDATVISVATLEKANAAISAFDFALAKALDQATTIGAIEARLEYTASNLTTSSENVQAAESTIRDADMAKEMTNYTKNNVLLQAAQSMLAQANQNSSAVLSLLQ
jgi:flagellin